jgi:predicted DNA-binding transcriptional regulator AlpA
VAKSQSLINKHELLQRVPYSYVQIWRLMVRNEFPRARKLGGKCFWLESEINEFLLSLPVRRLKGDVPIKRVRRNGSEPASNRR